MAKRIYVGNLSYEITDQDLSQLFGQCGFVSEATVVKDKATGQPKGFGFVEMPNDDEATHAVARLKGQDVKGRPIIVDFAEMRPVEGAVGSRPDGTRPRREPKRFDAPATGARRGGRGGRGRRGGQRRRKRQKQKRRWRSAERRISSRRRKRARLTRRRFPSERKRSAQFRFPRELLNHSLHERDREFDENQQHDRGLQKGHATVCREVGQNFDVILNQRELAVERPEADLDVEVAL